MKTSRLGIENLRTQSVKNDMQVKHHSSQGEELFNCSKSVDVNNAGMDGLRSEPLMTSCQVYTKLALDEPKSSTKMVKVKPSLEYTIQTIVYGEKPSEFFAVKMAEITADECDTVATVKVGKGGIVVDFDEDFDTKFFDISQEDFDEVVRRAAKDLGAENIDVVHTSTP